MMTKEEYKKELIRMWDSLRATSFGEKNCTGVICEGCPLLDTNCESPTNAFEMIEIIEKWSREHPKPKYKVSQLECDILEAFIDYGFVYYFYDSDLLMSLLRSGYFQGATSEMDIRNYFNDCEIA